MVRIYRHQVAKAIVVVCVVASLLTLLSWGLTQAPESYRNMNTDWLEPGMVSSGALRYDDRAEVVTISIEYFTEQEFDVWLVDDEEWDIMDAIPFSPGPWLRHGVAGAGVIEWTVSADEFEGRLLLVEEHNWYGMRGPGLNGSRINYDWEITTSSVVNPLESVSTWAVFGLIVLAVALLAWMTRLTYETIPDFTDLYPDFSASVEPSGYHEE
ncbi:MAG: hypothetical protein JSW25_07520 [Thermoplasmata archaeon]|nr:MAG: hypothetical protein JSW25_07520 [Thermoplasmata archaeon]